MFKINLNLDESSSSVGFHDIGLVSESGFRPIVPHEHSAPTLAFSIHEYQVRFYATFPLSEAGKSDF